MNFSESRLLVKSVYAHRPSSRSILMLSSFLYLGCFQIHFSSVQYDSCSVNKLGFTAASNRVMIKTFSFSNCFLTLLNQLCVCGRGKGLDLWCLVSP